MIDEKNGYHQIPSTNVNPSFFTFSIVHVTYHRDLEAHYRALLNISAQFLGRLLQHSISHLISAPSLPFFIALSDTHFVSHHITNKTLRHNPNTRCTVPCISSHHSQSVWQWRVLRLVTRKTHTSGCHQWWFLVAWRYRLQSHRRSTATRRTRFHFVRTISQPWQPYHSSLLSSWVWPVCAISVSTKAASANRFLIIAIERSGQSCSVASRMRLYLSTISHV